MVGAASNILLRQFARGDCFYRQLSGIDHFYNQQVLVEVSAYASMSKLKK
jgi:hypothetical protein